MNQLFFRKYCLNKGICYTLIDKNKTQKLGKDYYKTENGVVTEIFCSCPKDYTGLRCETPVENSVYEIINNNQFKNTSKVVMSNEKTKDVEYKLTKNNACPSEYRCLNGGTCVVDQVIGPKCMCTAEYTGLNCGQSKTYYKK